MQNKENEINAPFELSHKERIIVNDVFRFCEDKANESRLKMDPNKEKKVLIVYTGIKAIHSTNRLMKNN